MIPECKPDPKAMFLHLLDKPLFNEGELNSLLLKLHYLNGST